MALAHRRRKHALLPKCLDELVRRAPTRAMARNDHFQVELAQVGDGLRDDGLAIATGQVEAALTP
jgi:hypothetical protein